MTEIFKKDENCVSITPIISSWKVKFEEIVRDVVRTCLWENSKSILAG